MNKQTYRHFLRCNRCDWEKTITHGDEINVFAGDHRSFKCEDGQITLVCETTVIKEVSEIDI